MGLLLLRWLRRHPGSPRPLPLRWLLQAFMVALCFVPTIADGGFLRVPVPIPSFLIDGLIHRTPVGQVVAPLVIGTLVVWALLAGLSQVRGRLKA